MKRVVKFDYTENVVPPRCRKPRRVRFDDGEYTVNIKELTGKDVKIAFRVKDYDCEICNVVLYKGKLYRQVQYRMDNVPENRRYDIQPLNVNQKLDETNLIRNFDRRLSWWNTKEQNIDILKKAEKECISVDGYMYSRTGEPYYYCTTFGLGHNHGGTGFFIEWSDYADKKKIWGWSPLDKRYAQDKCIEIALRRGDDKSVEHINETPRNIEVLIPEASKRRYDKEY